MSPAELLTTVELVAGGTPLRPVEVERYPPGDPFAHAHPLQKSRHHWYFHRVGGGYRGGSFKGLDLTAGDGVCPEGLLLRAVEHPDGGRTDGPSRLVDLLLRLTAFGTVRELDAAIAGRSAWDQTSPLYLRPAAREMSVVRAARVGLGLRRFRPEPGHPAVRWLAAPERHLTDPARTRTGRVQLALAGLVGGPPRWRAWYADPGEPDGWYGRPLTAEGLCRLLGWADAATPPPNPLPEAGRGGRTHDPGSAPPPASGRGLGGGVKGLSRRASPSRRPGWPGWPSPRPASPRPAAPP